MVQLNLDKIIRTKQPRKRRATLDIIQISHHLMRRIKNRRMMSLSTTILIFWKHRQLTRHQMERNPKRRLSTPPPSAIESTVRSKTVSGEGQSLGKNTMKVPFTRKVKAVLYRRIGKIMGTMKQIKHSFWSLQTSPKCEWRWTRSSSEK